MNYLIITEGEKTEQIILKEVLKKYGFNIISKSRLINYEEIEVNIDDIGNSNDNIVIAQAPKNRLGELLKLYHKNNYDLDKVFGNNSSYFAGLFFIFDVDHTSNEDLKEMFNIHYDETDNGLLLVSSPCIEIMAEHGRTKEIKVKHLNDYKKQINKYVNDEIRYGKNVEQYIINNFEELSIKFLEQNTREFSSYNVMEHPQLVIEKINKDNLRTNEEVIYRYFTTVVYVAIAYICGLTKEINNIDVVKRFFDDNITCSTKCYN